MICKDQRQYVGYDGQQWTTLDDLRREHHNRFLDIAEGITAILTEPSFAIGQRAFLIETDEGNVLWDCLALLDEATILAIQKRGGLSAIAISHPHYYTTMIEWMDVFKVPVVLHAADRQWVMRPDPRIRFWDGEMLPLNKRLTLIRGGGHFDGGSMLHCAATSTTAGILFSGDIIQVVPDRRWVSFMYSYPNLIPLSESKVRRLVDAIEPYEFDAVYGAFHPLQVMTDGKNAIRRSMERYIRFLRGPATGG